MLPSTMHAVVLKDYEGRADSLALSEIPVPRPGPGQVLVQIAASPLNPSDLIFIRGRYGFRKTLPTIPGFEASGIVVAAGSGLLPRLLLRRRVACAAAEPTITGGTWAQYLVIPANRCIVLRKEVSMEQGATLLINPLTAWGLLEQARRGGYHAVVQTAAAGALGRMIFRLAQRFSIDTINIVRKSEQVELLQKMGAANVLNVNDADFDSELRDLCHSLGARIGFDAVAGELAARILRAQPRGSRLLVYGALSQKSPRIDPSLLIFEGKSIEGFWLSSWLRTKNMLSQLHIAGKVQRLLVGDLNTGIQTTLPLEEFARGLDEYKQNMTKGKILLIP